MTLVNLKKVESYENLESAILKAAKELRLKTIVKDSFEKEYNLSPIKRRRVYKYTNIMLMKNNDLKIGIKLYKGRQGYDWFGITKESASEKEIKNYLDTVSKNLYPK